tara:strand:+ start:14441 stop:15718 length:1278 start_codon:yes stop_codon:yes gene_type:complete
MKTKLAGGHNLFYLFIVNIVIFFANCSYSYQIYDYHTEQFIEKLNTKIVSVNSYDKKINFKIINNEFPNAFVTADNTIYITSGLLVYSPDYVSLLAVLAHELGHIENYHISKRKNEINNLKNLNSLGNLAAIFGSMAIQNPELIGALVFNKTAINNLYINFSQEQEIEADFYAVETLKKLNLPLNSVKKFLMLLEDKTKFNLVDEELKKFSTHPIFSERYKIIEHNDNPNNAILNQNMQKNYNFIKAKFMAYTDNGFANNLNGDARMYYDAIQLSKKGSLMKSLKKLNRLISKYQTNEFLIETKADILLSFGYKKEALDFYKKILINQPDNNYAKYNFFINLNYNNKREYNREFFLDNLNLIVLFPNNKILVSQFYNLSKNLEYNEWIKFFEILVLNKKDLKQKLIELKNNTKDYNLKKIIKLYT